MDQKKNVTIREIARTVGVSEATVSYALNSSGRVSLKTTERILQAADKLGYQKNPLISQMMKGMRKSLNTNFRGTLGFLHFLEADHSIINNSDFLGRVFCGARSQAENLGLCVDPISIRNKQSHARLDTILQSRAIHGVFLGSLDQLNRSIQIDLSKIGMVAIGYSYRNHPVHRIAPNNFDGILEAVTILSNTGHRRMGLAFHDPEIDYRSNYGFSSGLRLGCELNDLPVIKPLHHAAEDPESALSWCEKNKLDVIFTTTEEIFENAPGKPLVVSLTQEATEGRASLTQSPEQLGALALDELFGVVFRNEIGQPRVPKLVLSPLEMRGF